MLLYSAYFYSKAIKKGIFLLFLANTQQRRADCWPITNWLCPMINLVSCDWGEKVCGRKSEEKKKHWTHSDFYFLLDCPRTLVPLSLVLLLQPSCTPKKKIIFPNPTEHNTSGLPLLLRSLATQHNFLWGDEEAWRWREFNQRTFTLWPFRLHTSHLFLSFFRIICFEAQQRLASD